MKTKLKQITDSTINELLSNEIILPSSYFKCFDKYAKNIDIELENEDYSKELTKMISEEFDEINSYVNNAIKVIDKASIVTGDAQEAIRVQNASHLKELYEEIGKLKKELETLNENVYCDDLTKAKNKKWIYHKYLNNETKFNKDSILVLIDVDSYDYISNAYNQLISDNLLIFIVNYLKSKFKDEKLDYNIIRYLKDKFIISFDNSDLKEVQTLLHTVSSLLFETTLKSNSGIVIKPTFNHTIAKVRSGEEFHEVLTLMIKKVDEQKEK